jgi:hypothetical protein
MQGKGSSTAQRWSTVAYLITALLLIGFAAFFASSPGVVSTVYAQGSETPTATSTATADPTATATETATATATATSTPAGPGAFNLTGPANNSYLRVASAAQEFAWDASPDAGQYQVHGFQISNNVKIGDAFLVEVNAAGAGCDADTTCAVPVDLSAEANGQYAWTVIAINAQGEAEASNGPWFFTLNTAAIELVTNGGFEEPAASPGAKNPTGWLRVNPTGERRDCRAAKVPANVGGLCAYRATGGAAVSILSQKVPNAEVIGYGITGDDSLTVNVMSQAAAAPTGAVVRVVLKFTDGPKQNATVSLVPGTLGTDLVAVTGPIDIDDGKGTVKRISIQILSGTGGVFYVDDLSVELDAIAP